MMPAAKIRGVFSLRSSLASSTGMWRIATISKYSRLIR